MAIIVLTFGQFGPSSQSAGMVTVTVPMICMVGMVNSIGMVMLVGVMVSLVGKVIRSM